MKVYNDIIDTIIKKKCPDLTYKLDILRVNSACIVTDWLFTFYVRAFPLDIVRYFFLSTKIFFRHIWDIFLCLGDHYLIQTSVALLMCLEKMHDCRKRLDSMHEFRKNSYKVR